MQTPSLNISMIIVTWQLQNQFVQFTRKKKIILKTQPGIRDPGGFLPNHASAGKKNYKHTAATAWLTSL